MNILVDPLPHGVEIDGDWYDIRTDYRYSILFEQMMHDPDIDPDMKISSALELYYPIIPDNLFEAVAKILWFFSGGKDDHEKDLRESAERGSNPDPEEDMEDEPKDEACFSFEHDAEYIYAAFLQQYGIDLTETDMHWWKFKALFASLVEPCKFSTIVGYRTTKIPKNASGEQKAFLKKMKLRFALPLSESEQEYQDSLLEALRHGGDVDSVLNGEGG